MVEKQKPFAHFAIPVIFLIFVMSHPILGQYRQLNYQLDYNFYAWTCPPLESIVRFGVWSAMMNETRIAASLLRLLFHDCIVNGCDASVLLDDTPNMTGEKNSNPNRKSARGFEVIDNIKADVERYCPQTVSCVDILILAARDAVVLSGGMYWPVQLGRRDGMTASVQASNQQIPSPFEGAHTIGFAQCFTFKRRLFNYMGSGKPDPTLNSFLLQNLQSTCPSSDGANSNLAALDSVTINQFDNQYYKNLLNNSGLLESDQALIGDPRTASMVDYYSKNPYMFYNDFAASMVKLSNVGILTGHDGQIRKKCGSLN
ncbi:peroxidase 10-like isoform X2 [Macadamia integrifolia]|uniref:peroxidase 10-like isoform X2 n=1 Tax=Macadamia integrifolia TaxID=60698 RepID=UPI001C4E59FA|nr:peroxidase 10-like isoform X2 [Macadamia integrifolia]